MKKILLTILLVLIACPLLGQINQPISVIDSIAAVGDTTIDKSTLRDGAIFFLEDSVFVIGVKKDNDRAWGKVFKLNGVNDPLVLVDFEITIEALADLFGISLTDSTFIFYWQREDDGISGAKRFTFQNDGTIDTSDATTAFPTGVSGHYGAMTALTDSTFMIFTRDLTVAGATQGAAVYGTHQASDGSLLFSTVGEVTVEDTGSRAYDIDAIDDTTAVAVYNEGTVIENPYAIVLQYDAGTDSVVSGSSITLAVDKIEGTSKILTVLGTAKDRFVTYQKATTAKDTILFGTVDAIALTVVRDTVYGVEDSITVSPIPEHISTTYIDTNAFMINYNQRGAPFGANVYTSRIVTVDLTNNLILAISDSVKWIKQPSLSASSVPTNIAVNSNRVAVGLTEDERIATPVANIGHLRVVSLDNLTFPPIAPRNVFVSTGLKDTIIVSWNTTVMTPPMTGLARIDTSGTSDDSTFGVLTTGATSPYKFVPPSNNKTYWFKIYSEEDRLYGLGTPSSVTSGMSLTNYPTDPDAVGGTSTGVIIFGVGYRPQQ